MDPRTELAPRLARLPNVTVDRYEVPVARTVRSRLLGLALLDRERAGIGLLIPRCRSIHTFGMRFTLEVIFFDAQGRLLQRRAGVGPGRLLTDRRADSILELVVGNGETRGERSRSLPTQGVSGSRTRGNSKSPRL